MSSKYTTQHMKWTHKTQLLTRTLKKKNRSSHLEVFLRKGVLKICSKFTGEHPCQSVISIKINFSIKDFFSKYDQIRCFLRIWSHLLKKSFKFCAVYKMSPVLKVAQKWKTKSHMKKISRMSRKILLDLSWFAWHFLRLR